jgi:hypothetical protein
MALSRSAFFFDNHGDVAQILYRVGGQIAFTDFGQFRQQVLVSGNRQVRGRQDIGGQRFGFAPEVFEFSAHCGLSPSQFLYQLMLTGRTSLPSAAPKIGCSFGDAAGIPSYARIR